jgi:hypothetical protein
LSMSAPAAALMATSLRNRASRFGETVTADQRMCISRPSRSRSAG